MPILQKARPSTVKTEVDRYHHTLPDKNKNYAGDAVSAGEDPFPSEGFEA